MITPDNEEFFNRVERFLVRLLLLFLLLTSVGKIVFLELGSFLTHVKIEPSRFD
jgi:hypothetical protein